MNVYYRRRLAIVIPMLIVGSLFAFQGAKLWSANDRQATIDQAYRWEGSILGSIFILAAIMIAGLCFYLMYSKPKRRRHLKVIRYQQNAGIR